MRGLYVYLSSAVAGVVISVRVAGSVLPQSVDVSASAMIEAPGAEVWRIASDFEGAFEGSNPSHRGTTVLSDPKTPLRDGLRFRQEEYVGGLRGVLEAELFDVFPRSALDGARPPTIRSGACRS
jgi:hypothetical protein